jgi:hypothetical protein
MILRLLITSALLFSMAACSFKKPSAQSPEEKAAEEVIQNIEQQKFNGQLSSDNVQIQFLEAEYPGSYELVITWPKDVPGMKVSLNEGHFKIVHGANSLRTTVMHTEKHSVHMVALNSIGGEISAHSITVYSPSDLIVGNDLHLHENTNLNLNRVYINKNGRILTHGKNLSLQTNKLYVDAEIKKSNTPMDLRYSHIITAVPGEVASSLDQLSGSKIDITAKKAYGHLAIAMIGVNGQDGSNGANAVAEASLDGTAGKSAEVRQDIDSCMKPDGMPCSSQLKLFCISPPTNGGNGQKGFTGGRGQDGWSGGNSGTLAVVVEDDSEFRLEVALRRGQPGKGGSGGLGSAGGRGGPAGDNQFGKCRPAQNGAPGPQGDMGAPGANGQPGLIHQPITNLKSALIYEVR